MKTTVGAKNKADKTTVRNGFVLDPFGYAGSCQQFIRFLRSPGLTAAINDALATIKSMRVMVGAGEREPIRRHTAGQSKEVVVVGNSNSVDREDGSDHVEVVENDFYHADGPPRKKQRVVSSNSSSNSNNNNNNNKYERSTATRLSTTTTTTTTKSLPGRRRGPSGAI